MSFGKTNSQSQSQQQSTSQQSIDPGILAADTANLQRAQGVANTPTTAYTGILRTPVAGQINDASAAAQRLTDFFAPTVVGTGYKASTIDPASVGNVTPGLLSTTDLTPYQNPYTGQVIDATTAQLLRTKGITDAADAAKATAAGAFGGSRSAVLQNLDDNTFQQNLNSTVAGLNQDNFNQARGAASTDIANRLAADTTNLSKNLTVAGANQGAENTAGQFGAAAENAASQANQAGAISSAGIQQGAAGLLGQLGQAIMSNDTVGIQAAYQEFLRQQQDPLLKQQLLNQSLGLLPNPVLSSAQSTGSSTGSQSGFNIGLGSPSGGGSGSSAGGGG